MAKYDTDIAREIQVALNKITPLNDKSTIADAISYNAQVLAAVELAFGGVMVDRKDFERLKPRLGTPPFPPVPKEETPRPPFKMGDLVVLTDDVLMREVTPVRVKKGDIAKVIEDRGSCVWLVSGPNERYAAFVDVSHIRLMGKHEPK
jgi:hypothetical protein